VVNAVALLLIALAKPVVPVSDNVSVSKTEDAVPVSKSVHPVKSVVNVPLLTSSVSPTYSSIACECEVTSPALPSA